MKKIRQNLHTHTCFCDGRDTPLEMAAEAVRQKFTILGFSSHGYNHPADSWSMDEQREAAYLASVQEAREKFAGQIEIYTGVEEDSIGRRYEKGKDFDYILSSVHFVQKNGKNLPVDYDEETVRTFLKDEYDGDFLAYAKDYYAAVTALADREEADIIGHLDLIAKYNENNAMFDPLDPAYLQMAFAAADALIDAGKILEINTGAMARGCRTEPYPQREILKHIREKGGKICINADCHDRRKLMTGYQMALDLAKSAGFETISVFTRDGFVSVPIENIY